MSYNCSVIDLKPSPVIPPPIVSWCNDRIRPLLDAVDKLRSLEVMKEGIELPSIVVVGDQSSGKSSVLESLAGISLPRGTGMCTRVPLIMCLKHHSGPEPKFSLEYMGQIVETDEANVSEDINLATQKIAGNAKGIKNIPITLVVKRNGVPDLTMIDLPGITRVVLDGQPEDIQEQIKGIITEYIRSEKTIILNVLQAEVDFTNCETIMMSRKADKTGQRTMAVVTKSDKGAEGLLEKVTNDDVNIGLGYVCVRNRVGDETFEEARFNEARLFETDPLLSKFDKSIVGVPMLARTLVQIQANIISKCLPDIVKQIKEKLSANVTELNNMPPYLSTVPEATSAFLKVMGSVKESLRKILIRGEYDECPDDESMHATARLADMLNNTSAELQTVGVPKANSEDFLMEEIRVLEESKGIRLPNFLTRTAFMIILERKIKGVSRIPVDFMSEAWAYIETVVKSILMRHCHNYPQLQSSTRRAAIGLIAKMKVHSTKYVEEILEMETIADYTCSPEYMSVWNQMMWCQPEFMKTVGNNNMDSTVTIAEIGRVNVANVRKHQHVAQQAFDLRARMTSYWKIVLFRLIDSMALHLSFSIQKLVNHNLEKEIVNEFMGSCEDGIKRLLQESPSVATKRERLKKSIRLLKESQDVVEKVMDRLAVPE